MSATSDYDRIASVLRYLHNHQTDQPGLDELADHVGLSPHHFHRLFSRWAGITPKSFLKCLTVEHAKRRLQAGDSVLDTSLDIGLSGPGRLHDLCVTLEAASPGEIKSRGESLLIEAGFADSPLGRCFVAETQRGICHFSFVDQVDREDAQELIRDDWPRSTIQWKDEVAQRVIASAFQTGGHDQGTRSALSCFVRGTEFQVKVWRALLRIRYGQLTSYGKISQAIGSPQAARAVGSAVGSNSIGVLIPCHRVIRETGVIGDYRWGNARKRALIAMESARLDES